MKKCVSTCLFNAERYKNSFLKLPESVDKYLPDFDLVIYHDNSLTDLMKSNLKNFNCVKLIEMPTSIGRSGCFWRYLAYDEYDLCFFRDVDLPIEPNDIIVVNDFIKKDFDVGYIFVVHTRKSYPRQGFLMGGLFLMRKNNFIPSMNDLMNQYPYKEKYGTDEEFLAKIIYPLLKPICYFEPRNTVKSTVFLEGDYETYYPLTNNYSY